MRCGVVPITTASITLIYCRATTCTQLVVPVVPYNLDIRGMYDYYFYVVCDTPRDPDMSMEF